MVMDSLTTPEWEQRIGEQIRSLRLLKNIQQATVAKQGGISVSALKNLESGNGATISTLVKVLRVLDRLDWLTTLTPQVTISPMQMVKRTATRQRARRKKGEDV